MTAQRKRIETISTNLANINTTRTSEGGPYRRRSVVFSAVHSTDNFGKQLDSALKDHVREVQVTGVVQDHEEPKMVYNPEHPDADERGYVAMPNVNLMVEMVDMISATRSYEANVASINATKGMISKAISIGGR
jgi:flagellar basal-body rod protein FlgC